MSCWVCPGRDRIYGELIASLRNDLPCGPRGRHTLETRTAHSALRVGVTLLSVAVLACDVGTPKREPAATSKTLAPASSDSTAHADLLFPVRQKYAHNLKITEKYVRMDDYTTVDLDQMRLEDGLKLDAYFLYSGTKFLPPDKVTFTFSESSETWKYLTYRPLRLLLDDSVRVDLGEVQHDGTVGNGYVLEIMRCQFPVSQLLQIVAAKKVEGQLGLTKFTLKQNQLEALRDLASRMAPTQ